MTKMNKQLKGENKDLEKSLLEKVNMLLLPLTFDLVWPC